MDHVSLNAIVEFADAHHMITCYSHIWCMLLLNHNGYLDAIVEFTERLLNGPFNAWQGSCVHIQSYEYTYDRVCAYRYVRLYICMIRIYTTTTTTTIITITTITITTTTITITITITTNAISNNTITNLI